MSQPLPALPETITIRDAKERYGCSLTTLRKAISLGEIKARKPGREILIDLDSGDAWWRTSGEKLVKKPRGARR